jgi:hypothetical protein
MGGYRSNTKAIKWIIDVIWPLFEVETSKEQDTMFKKGVDTAVDILLLYLTSTYEVEVHVEQLKSLGEMLRKARPKQEPESRVLSAADRDLFDIAPRCIRRLEFLEQEVAVRERTPPPPALVTLPSASAPPKPQRAPLRTIRK